MAPAQTWWAANAAAWRAYVSAGGLVITEYSVAENVYNAIFQTNVAAGNMLGACSDNINPAVRFTLADPFWIANGALPVQANLTGCGLNMQGWNQPIVRLGGWDANSTSLAYRDLGAGRVWLVEADWQDNQAEFNAASRQIMRHMIFNGRRACAGQVIGGVCVVHQSAECVNGSVEAYCDQQGGEPITFAEFQAIVAGGWVRPNGSYHTMAVAQYDQCPNDAGYGNVGIPGFGDFNLWACGENQNYCNRAMICVTR